MSEDPVTALRAALADRDVAQVARLLPATRVAVPFADGRPRVALTDEGRVLPAFLSMDAWEAFRSTDEIRLLSGDAFRQLVEAAGVEAVLFDPATAAMQVPAVEVLSLLEGEYVDASGRHVTGHPRFEPDPETRGLLARQLPEATADALTGRAWVVGRLAGDGAVPTVALASDVSAAEVEELGRLLRSYDAPAGLEVLQLDAAATAEASSSWAEARLVAREGG
jgi:hypothetical protein